jgi:hypothetical protein
MIIKQGQGTSEILHSLMATKLLAKLLLKIIKLWLRLFTMGEITAQDWDLDKCYRIKNIRCSKYLGLKAQRLGLAPEIS